MGKVYGVFDETTGVEARGRFIIDPDGVIQVFEVLTPPVAEMLMDLFAKLRHSNWLEKVRVPRLLPLAGGLAKKR